MAPGRLNHACSPISCLYVGLVCAVRHGGPHTTSLVRVGRQGRDTCVAGCSTTQCDAPCRPSWQTKFTSDAALIERGRDAEITTLQARVSAPPRAHTPHRLAGTSSHWAAHLKEHGVHTRPNTSHSPAAHRTGHTANPPMTPIRKSSSAANVLSSARSARSRHSKSRGSAHPVHGRARPSQRGNATRNVGFARAPGWQSSRSSRGGAGGGGGGATDRSIQSYLSATARSWAGGDTGRGGGVTTSKARRSAHLHHTNTELTTAATVVLTEAEANFKNNMRTVLPPAVRGSGLESRVRALHRGCTVCAALSMQGAVL